MNVPIEILSRYPRPFTFKDPKTKKILTKGRVIDFALVYHDDVEMEYWKGVERLKHEDGREEFRFMYWARRKGNQGWKWGQFNLCLPIELLNQLFQEIYKKGWVKTVFV